MGSTDDQHTENPSHADATGNQQEFTFEASSDKKSRLWLFTALVLIGGAVGMGLYWSQSIRVNRIDVHGTELAEVEQIRDKSRFALNQPRDSVSMLNVIDSVRQADFVRDANVSISLNGTMELEIEERSPLALLADRSPKMWVDRDGVLLPLRLGRSVNIPLLYGFSENGQDTLQSEAFRQVSNFLTTARDHNFTWSTLSEVRYSAERGIIAVTGVDETQRLIFGKQNFERKMKYWKAYYGQVLKHKKNPEHREVDLRYEGQVVTR